MNDEEVRALKRILVTLGEFTKTIFADKYKCFHDSLLELEKKYPDVSWIDDSVTARAWLGVLHTAGERKSIEEMKALMFTRRQVCDIIRVILDEVEDESVTHD